MLGLDLDTPLTPEETTDMVDSIANAVVARKLETPALLLIETHRPLSFITSQGLAFALPVIGPLVGPERVARLSRLLRDRGNIDLLTRRIEELASERDHPTTQAAEERG